MSVNLKRAKQIADWDAGQGYASSHSPDARTVPTLLAGILDALCGIADALEHAHPTAARDGQTEEAGDE